MLAIRLLKAIVHEEVLFVNSGLHSGCIPQHQR